MKKNALLLQYDMDMGHIEMSAKRAGPWCCFIIGAGRHKWI